MIKTKRASALSGLMLFLVGGLFYTLLEIIFRGHTHISMFYAGGLSLLFIGIFDGQAPKLNTIPKMIVSGCIITSVEFVFGIVFNVFLGLGVWDYSGELFNVFGQICPRFSLLWVILSYPAILISKLVRRFSLYLISVT